MQHKGTVTLTTPRLTLRPFIPEDIPAAFRNWCSDPEVTRFLRWPAHSSEQITRMVLEGWIAAYHQPDFYQWAIVPGEVGEPVGTISVVAHEDAARKLHIGYCLGRPWQGKGYMTEAFREVIRFLFEEVGANRIESQHDPENAASGKVMLRCGLAREGILRKADWSNRGIVDACMHALLREDWERQQRG
ncbi:MAG: GNAT family N-acetyltransferase [Clostridiales bacterium]|nr:GNAT family N-acetyltransferase [Clostridiales bacterium]